MNIYANKPGLKSWVNVPADSDFPIQNLPFGVYQSSEGPRLCTAIGDYIADLNILAEHGFFDDLGIEQSVFQQTYLNDFIALGKEKTRAVRNRLAEILDDDLEEWDASELRDFFLLPRADAKMLMPVKVGDYTDFYSSEQHATNVGTMFRDPENALLPNWKHLPVGYHGRASSIVVSGTPVRRPQGQTIPAGADKPVFGPSKALDFELEMAFIVGKENELGTPVTTAQADDYIFGMVLFNDWSARDIQKWEYQPLGPFLAKSFASTVSPWVVTMDALDTFRIEGPVQDPAVLPYLQTQGKQHYDIQLEVSLQTAADQVQLISRSNFKHMYWSIAQQLAHQTVNGCNLNIGDMCASGTISGPTPDSYGSMLELSWRGTKPIRLADGSERRFLEDGDTIIFRGYAEKDGVRIGFGEARGTILPVHL